MASVATSPTTETVYQFKVTLIGPKPPIWRRIQVPKEYTFYALHLAIQDSMGWEDCHLHQFAKFSRMPGWEGRIGENLYEEIWGKDALSGKATPITDYFQALSDTADYLYDFGAYWEHKIVLEKILSAVPGEKYPKCIAGRRPCLPEDGSCSDDSYECLKPVKFTPKSVSFEKVEERWMFVGI